MNLVLRSGITYSRGELADVSTPDAVAYAIGERALPDERDRNKEVWDMSSGIDGVNLNLGPRTGAGCTDPNSLVSAAQVPGPTIREGGTASSGSRDHVTGLSSPVGDKRSDGLAQALLSSITEDASAIDDAVDGHLSRIYANFRRASDGANLSADSVRRMPSPDLWEPVETADPAVLLEDSKRNILAQSNVAILAQANVSPQSVLALFR